MTSSELLSKTLDYVRFPLIVGVVCIHFNISADSTWTFNGVDWTVHPMWYNCIITLFSKVLTDFAVPLFYVIAGYFFFYKGVGIQPTFTIPDYVHKIGKRIKTLLVPFFVWNILFLLAQVISALINNVDIVFSCKSILLTFWDATISPVVPAYGFLLGGGSPIDPPLWFVRDLFLIMLTTPLIYYSVKKIHFFFPLACFVVWMGIWCLHIPMLSQGLKAFFFFSIGCYFSIEGKNFVYEMSKIKYCPIIYPLLAITYIFLLVLPQNGILPMASHIVGNISILVGIIAFINICSTLLTRGKIHPHPFLSGSVFFIFAAHWAILIPCVPFIIFKFLGENNSPLGLLCLFFLTIVCTTLLCLLLYYLLKRFVPKACMFLTGDR